MNIFNKEIYKSHLAHSQKGQKWSKHKYLYITPTGRYVYESDLPSAQQRQESQIRSAHQVATTEPKPVARTSGTVAGANKVTTPANRNAITIKSRETKVVDGGKGVEKKDAVKTNVKANGEEKKTGTTDVKYNEEKRQKAIEEAQAALGNAKDEKKSGKKGGSGKKKGSSKSSSKATKTEEQKQMGLSDDDLQKMEVNTDATNRDEVLKNIALKVIRGDYGNGADRRTKLGSYYNEVQSRVNEIMREGNIQREEPAQQEPQSSEQKKTTSAASPSQSSNQSTNSSSNSVTKKEYKMEEYSDDDPDFSEENMKKATRLGNTDFHTFKRKDGKYVIFEEDMKWIVDEKPSSKMIKNIESMEDYAQRSRKNNVRYSAKDWERMAGEAINGKDFTNLDPGRNYTTKSYQDQTRKFRTQDQIASAHQTATKKKKGVLYTRKSDGKYTGKRTKVYHSDLEEGLFLMHFGNRNSGRYRRGSGDRPYQHETSMRKNSTFKSRRSMSDEDLQKSIDRVRKESELLRLERDNRSQGQKFVEDVLTSVGRDVIRKAGTGALLYAGKQFAIKILGDEELGEFISRGGPKKEKK